MRQQPAILVEEAPEWSFTGGHFVVEWNGQRWAYSPHNFFAMFAAMGEVARQYRHAGAEIIEFPMPEDVRA